MKRFLLPLLLLTPSCLLSESESQKPPGQPTAFRLRLAYGTTSPSAPRTELAILPRPEGGWMLLVRRSSGLGEWPRVWDQSYAENVDSGSLTLLVEELDQSGFFDLASQYLEADHPDQEVLTLEVVRWGRRHLVLASGRQPSKLVASLKALDGVLSIQLRPWPAWLSKLEGSSMNRPRLVVDLEGSLAVHRRWLTLEPGRSPLHLDLFALELALGNKEAARRELDALSEDQTLQGLIPELEALMR